MILPVVQELIEPIYGTLRMRGLGLMDCRHRWERGRTVSWAVLESPSLLWAREDFHEVPNPNDPVRYRTVTFRMKEIVADPGIVSRTDLHWAALALEAGRLTDLAFIREFHEGDLGDPRLTRALDRIPGIPPWAYQQEMARRFHEDPAPRSFVPHHAAAPPEPVRPIEGTWTAAHHSALTLEMIQEAARLLREPLRPAGPQTVEEMERYLQANLLCTFGTPRGRGRRRLDTATDDKVAPKHAKPLAPLPDWLKKVDDLIEEVSSGAE